MLLKIATQCKIEGCFECKLDWIVQTFPVLTEMNLDVTRVCYIAVAICALILRWTRNVDQDLFEIRCQKPQCCKWWVRKHYYYASHKDWTCPSPAKRHVNSPCSDIYVPSNAGDQKVDIPLSFWEIFFFLPVLWRDIFFLTCLSMKYFSSYLPCEETFPFPPGDFQNHFLLHTPRTKPKLLQKLLSKWSVRSMTYSARFEIIAKI